MNDTAQQTLTSTDYVILGLLSNAPQSGYALRRTIEMTDGRWSMGTASGIYPALRRLERLALIAAAPHKSRMVHPRKVYSITNAGESLLDEWLQCVPNVGLNEWNIALVKFLFAERRLSRDVVLQWLEEYERSLAAYEQLYQTWYAAQSEVSSPHQQLMIQATMMEWTLHCDWIRLARQRLLQSPSQFARTVEPALAGALAV